MKKEKIWLSSPHMGGNEQKYIQDAFEQNWIAPLGPNVNTFEGQLESYLQKEVKVASLSAGTAALHLALIACGVKTGDEVICQSMTFAASANPIVYLGATPVFVDSEKESWNICPEQLEIAIKDRIAKGKKPKAIVAVHLYGMPYLANEVHTIADQYNIPVIEDAAEALGSTYQNQKCGTFGRFGVLSFNGNKIITTSGGGALVCHSQKEKDQAVFLATQARGQAPHYQHSTIGYNYRLSNISAGIGRGQMEVLDKRVAQRRQVFEHYQSHLNWNWQPEMKDSFSNRWLTTGLLSSYEEREGIRLYLEKENIESRPLWKPMHLQPVFKDAPAYLNGVSEDLFNRGLCLPSGSNMTEEDLERVVEAVRGV